MINTFKLIWRSSKIKQILYNKLSTHKVFIFRNIVCRKIPTTIEVAYLQKLTYGTITLYSIYKHNQNKNIIDCWIRKFKDNFFHATLQTLWLWKNSPSIANFFCLSPVIVNNAAFRTIFQNQVNEPFFFHKIIHTTWNILKFTIT